MNARKQKAAEYTEGKSAGILSDLFSGYDTVKKQPAPDDRQHGKQHAHLKQTSFPDSFLPLPNGGIYTKENNCIADIGHNVVKCRPKAPQKRNGNPYEKEKQHRYFRTAFFLSQPGKPQSNQRSAPWTQHIGIQPGQIFHMPFQRIHKQDSPQKKRCQEE